MKMQVMGKVQKISLAQYKNHQLEKHECANFCLGGFAHATTVSNRMVSKKSV